MAAEWEKKSVAELQAAGALLVEDGNHGENRPRPDEFSTAGIQFIRAADMGSGRVLFESAQRINEVARQRVRKGIGAGGDVLLSHKGTVGKVAYVPLDGPPFVCSPQTTFWRVKDPKQLDRRYIYFFLLSRTFREQLDSRKGETDMADYVSLTTQRTLKVTVPPIADQKAIAAVLGALDDKIELNRQMNATLEAMARALFQSWFVDFDPVRAKLDGVQPPGLDLATAAIFPASFQDSEAGHIPRGWTVGKVGDLATLSRGAVNPGNFPTETFDHFSLPAFDDDRIPKMEIGSTIKSNKLVVTPNSVLLSKLNPHIPRVWLPDLYPTRRSVCSTEFMAACSKRGVSREYLFSLFTSSAFASVYGTLVTGTTGSHQRIRPESVLDMKVIVPPPPLIQTFADVAKPMFDRINRDTDQSRTLATLRDPLLPKLLSGELSVAVVEIRC